MPKKNRIKKNISRLIMARIIDIFGHKRYQKKRPAIFYSVIFKKLSLKVRTHVLGYMHAFFNGFVNIVKQ